MTLEDIEHFHWLPASCSYRLLVEGGDLPAWHPLRTGSKAAMHKAGASVRGKIISEAAINKDYLEDYIVLWPLQYDDQQQDDLVK